MPSLKGRDWRWGRLPVRKHCCYPVEQVSSDFVAVDLVEHFVSSARVEMVRDVSNACRAVTIYKGLHSAELLAHGVVAAREQVDRQTGTYPPKVGQVGQSRRGRQE
jgi:hypothetical protein